MRIAVHTLVCVCLSRRSLKKNIYVSHILACMRTHVCAHFHILGRIDEVEEYGSHTYILSMSKLEALRQTPLLSPAWSIRTLSDDDSSNNPMLGDSSSSNYNISISRVDDRKEDSGILNDNNDDEGFEQSFSLFTPIYMSTGAQTGSELKHQQHIGNIVNNIDSRRSMSEHDINDLTSESKGNDTSNHATIHNIEDYDVKTKSVSQTSHHQSSIVQLKVLYWHYFMEACLSNDLSNARKYTYQIDLRDMQRQQQQIQEKQYEYDRQRKRMMLEDSLQFNTKPQGRAQRTSNAFIQEGGDETERYHGICNSHSDRSTTLRSVNETGARNDFSFTLPLNASHERFRTLFASVGDTENINGDTKKSTITNVGVNAIQDINTRCPFIAAAANTKGYKRSQVSRSGPNRNCVEHSLDLRARSSSVYDNGNQSGINSPHTQEPTEMLEFLMRFMHYDVNVTDVQYKTALFYSVYNRHYYTVKMLLARKADVNHQDENLMTPLMVACASNCDKIANARTHRDSDRVHNDRGHGNTIPSRNNSNADTRSSMDPPSMNSNDYSSVSALIIQLLLAHKADISMLDQHQQSALHYAASLGTVENIHILLNADADVLACDGNGDTAVDVVERRGEWDVFQAMLRIDSFAAVVGGDDDTGDDNSSDNLIRRRSSGEKHTHDTITNSIADDNDDSPVLLQVEGIQREEGEGQSDQIYKGVVSQSSSGDAASSKSGSASKHVRSEGVPDTGSDTIMMCTLPVSLSSSHSILNSDSAVNEEDIDEEKREERMRRQASLHKQQMKIDELEEKRIRFLQVCFLLCICMFRPPMPILAHVSMNEFIHIEA